MAQLTVTSVIQAHHVNKLVDAFTALSTTNFEEAAVEVQSFFSVEKLIEIGLFRQVPNAFVFGHIGSRFVEDQCFTFRWKQKTKQELDCRGFTGTVWPQQSEYLTSVNL